MPIEQVEFVSEVQFNDAEHILKEFESKTEAYYDRREFDYFGRKYTVDTVGYELTLTRNSISYLFTYYFPVTGMVYLASISFMIPPEMVPGRIALLVTLLLTMISLFGNVEVESNNY